MTKNSEKLRWGIERRLQFIEFRLYWDGRINRSDIVKFFGVSVPQASADISRYQQISPQNIVYDPVAKTYVATKVFEPKHFKPSASHYLAQLRLLKAGILGEEELWLSHPPSFEIVPTIQRTLPTDNIRQILDAIQTKSAITIKYQSLTKMQEEQRWISPHAIIFDGFRWHVRSWCYEHNDFRDFVLARISSTSKQRPSNINFDHDIEWKNYITLRIIPNTKFKDGQKKAIENEYGMKKGVLEIHTRICLFYYLDYHFGFMLPLDKQHVILDNREEVERACKKAKLDSQKAFNQRKL